MRHSHQLLSITLGTAVTWFALAGDRVRAADGFMVHVTVDQGEIKDGDRTLATVKKGTRLWVFSEKSEGQWAEVKVPQQQSHGWLAAAAFAKVEDTREDEADKHWWRYNALDKEGKSDEAIAEYREYLRIKRDSLGNDHPDVADTLEVLSELLQSQGKYVEARQCYEEALSICRETKGEQDRHTAEVLHYLGSLALKQKDNVGARKYFMQALEIRRKFLDDDNTEATTTLDRLGWLLKSENDYAGAKEFFDEALALRRKHLGDKHADTAWSRRSIAVLLKDQGNYAAARKESEALLPLFREVFDPTSASVATVLNDLGVVAGLQNDYVSAKKYYEESLAMRRETSADNDPEIARTLSNLGGVLKTQGDLVGAKKCYEEALTIRRAASGDKSTDAASTLSDLGWLLKSQKDYAGARKYFDEALAIRREVLGEKHVDTAWSRRSIAVLLKDQGNYPAAREEAEALLPLFRELFPSKPTSVATLLNDLGNVLIEQGDYTAARNYYEESLSMRREAEGDKSPEAARVLENLGNVFKEQGDIATAHQRYDESLAIRREVLGEKHVDTANSLNALAHLYKNEGDYERARQYYDEVIAIRKELLGEKHIETIWALDDFGVLLQAQGDFAGARKIFEETLEIERKVLGNLDADTAITIAHLASLLQDQGDYVAARRYRDEELAIERALKGDKNPDTATTLSNLGSLLQAQKDLRGARQFYDEALAIRREVLGDKDPDTAWSLHALGSLLQEQGDYELARKHYDEALAIRLELFGERSLNTASSLSALGSLHRIVGDYRAARQHAERALAIRQEILGDEFFGLSGALHSLGWAVAADGDPTNGAEHVERARRLIRRHEAQVLPALTEREQLLFIANEHEEDWIKCLSFGFERHDDVRIAALSAGWLLNGKAVAQEALAEAALLSKPETAPLVEKLRGVRTRLAQLSSKNDSPENQRRIAVLESDQQDLVRKIGAAGTGFSAEEPWISIGTVRGQMPAGSAMVNVVRFRPYNFTAKDPAQKWLAAHYVAWVVPAIDEGAVQVVDLGEAEVIDDAVGEFRKAMSAADDAIEGDGEEAASAALAKTLAPLSDLLWKPLREPVAGKKEIILSPDGALWLVPWAALTLDDDKFLLEEFKLRYVISGRELVNQRVARTGITPPAVFANPNFDFIPNGKAADRPAVKGTTNQLARRSAALSGDVARLPGTAREATAIAPSLERIGRAKPVVYLDDLATETQFKQLFRPRVLVLSTHGFFLEDQAVQSLTDAATPSEADAKGTALTASGAPIENPLLRCGLLLAGSNRRDEATNSGLDDGVLTGLEIVSTDLRGTEMVVLSACETGVGEIRSGEGVAGLRQAFELAGAKSVVATLWQIPDAETSQLMTDYFVYCSQGQSKADALRYAQLNRIKEHREKSGAAHPFYWAAFTLTGAE